jgi:hypothetical protein
MQRTLTTQVAFGVQERASGLMNIPFASLMMILYAVTVNEHYNMTA